MKAITANDLMEQILNALKTKLKEQDKATEKYEYRCGIHDAIKIVETFVNKDKVEEFTEQPFNLETALKHPEWVYFRNGEKPLEWHWFKTAQWQIVSISPKKEMQVNYENGAYHYDDEIDAYFNPISSYDLILRVPYQTVYVSFLPYGEAKWNSNDAGVDGQFACVPVKIPAND